MERITVTVHTADPLLRDGVRRQLGHQPGITLRERVPDGAGEPDGPEVAVVVTDRLDDDRLRELRRLSRTNACRVVLVTGELREPELLDVLECRIHGILWRHEAGGERLAAMVRSAARGGNDLPQEIVGRLLELLGRLRRGAGGAGAPPPFGLVEREVDVLRLVAEGLETRQIADKLCYSERTIKNILHNLMTRLRLRNRAHAVAYALREGHI
ncbi:helix-turn-helix transcriptional regulator [Actinoplanes philippinensis]|uniref:DNA-binding response regulator, NarL/FixJ family, contains REC and HTH domains n=1 Tax=Actinoplanes philippinensis TaxID=35752 RepID=A0A1I2HGR2_9ACTN|nr:response regulator transcription factor [Actinoplanes philippinensis]GIE81782.1 helix-turn-helix transcriptional regulator [Actinoplanes philippinensis]SFF28728.1 DNA-binding response regulator, NarL/FixJ family, contains REC and HTH domains [Actinoplanes philippinensis]